jgi:hypothetical protein
MLLRQVIDQKLVTGNITFIENNDFFDKAMLGDERG